MNYDFLGQDGTMTTTTVAPSSGFRSFFLPIRRFFPTFFPPSPAYVAPPPCVPVQVPEGVLGRNTNGQLTVNGQTFCNTTPGYAAPAYRAPVPYGPIYF